MHGRALTLVSCLAMVAVSGAQASDWKRWRGPFRTGMAVGDAPLRWDETTNVVWKVAIPGRGHSTPLLVGDRLLLTTAVPTGRGSGPTGPGRAGGGAAAGLEHRFEVLSIDRASGDTVWQRTATVATPHEGYHHVYGSFASNSPVADGERLFAFFGSRGLYAYDLAGTLLWEKDFGVQMRMDMQFGEGTAVALHDGRLILHFDHLEGGFLAMLDPESGREIWRTARDERFNWAEPYVVEHGGERQIVVNGLSVRGYDFETGALAWEAAGLGENTIPQPVQYEDLVFAMSGHTVKKIMAIRLGGTGDLTGTDAIVWSTLRGAPYTPSPLLHDGILYVLTDNGRLSAFDAETGNAHYLQQRLPRPYSFKASPVGANGKLYLASEDEDVVVVRMGETFDVLATNTLKGHSFIASPIIVGGHIYLRSRTHLFRIGSAEASSGE